jgi:hypothetical protein
LVGCCFFACFALCIPILLLAVSFSQPFNYMYHHYNMLYNQILSLTISVHFIDHVLKFCFCGILTQWPHHGPQFFCCNGAITVFIKQAESFFEFWKLE